MRRRSLILQAVLVVAISGCVNDNTGPGEDPGSGPAALLVTISDPSISAGKSFGITVTALTGVGILDQAFQGTVILSASSGTLTPASASLVQGTATVQATLSGLSGAGTITAVAGKVSASAPVTGLVASAVARLEIVPGSMLLTSTGQSQRLQVRAFDASGKSIQPPSVTWQSSASSVVSVSADGQVTAGSALGSAQIVAQTGSLASVPALAIVAQPVPGAMLVADSQVVSEISAVDPAAAYRRGWLYKVRLKGATPATGQILLATGAAPVGGRVVSAVSVGSEIEVTLALTSIREMFQALSINETISLKRAKVTVAPSASKFVTSTVATPSGTGFIGGRGPFTARHQRVIAAADGLEFDLGPFECEASLLSPTATIPLSAVTPSYDIDPDLQLDLVYSPTNGFQKFIVRGGLSGGITVNPVFSVAVESKVECKVQLATLILPIGGPLSLIIGGQVPLGVGFELGGKLGFGNIGYDASVRAGATATLGIDCTTGCRPVAAMTGSATGYFKPILPPSSALFQAELTGGGFAWASLAIGNQFLNALQFEAFEAKAGLTQTALLATAQAQAADTLSASSFTLSFDVEAGTGSTLSALADLLEISLAELKVESSTPLAQSPKGTFHISPGSVRSATSTRTGDSATFILGFDPVTYLGGYAIDSVEIFRRVAGAGTAFTLEPAPGSCGRLAPSSGQNAFACRAVMPQQLSGDQQFFAFVRPRLFGVPVPVLLEVSENARAKVSVDTTAGVNVSVDPASATLAAGQTKQFAATVTGSTNTQVTWSAGGGTVSSTGLFTAGSTNGNFQVKATSVADNTTSASAAVTIGGEFPIGDVYVGTRQFQGTGTEFPLGLIFSPQKDRLIQCISPSAGNQPDEYRRACATLGSDFTLQAGYLVFSIAVSGNTVTGTAIIGASGTNSLNLTIEGTTITGRLSTSNPGLFTTYRATKR